MTRALLFPLELVYAAALSAKNARYDKTTPRRLNAPVISVGNLSVGGSGKTPLVIRLAQILEEEGFHPDVLSRGYGRSGSAAEQVEPQGSAQHFGDEPLMIAQTARVPVFVGASRYEAGLLAEQKIPAAPGRLHLLDDGFQHRELARAVDIVAIHRSDFSDRLLPSGRLREPRASLRRADVIVLREEDTEFAAGLVPFLRSGTLFWKIRRTLVLPEDGKSAVAFCGIARPREFFRALESAGTELCARVSFRDHHRYTAKDIYALCKLGIRHKCQQFITTEKDAVKLTKELRDQLSTVAPLHVAALRLEIVDERAAIGHLRERIGL